MVYYKKNKVADMGVFLTVRKPEKGIVYVLRFVLDCDTVVYKIGITTRTINERLLEIVGDFFNKYRYIPNVKARKFTSTVNYAEMEKRLHKEYADCSHYFDKKFNGSTEFFKIADEDILLHSYSSMIEEYSNVSDNTAED